MGNQSLSVSFVAVFHLRQFPQILGLSIQSNLRPTVTFLVDEVNIRNPARCDVLQQQQHGNVDAWEHAPATANKCNVPVFPYVVCMLIPKLLVLVVFSVRACQTALSRHERSNTC